MLRRRQKGNWNEIPLKQSPLFIDILLHSFKAGEKLNILMSFVKVDDLIDLDQIWISFDRYILKILLVGLVWIQENIIQTRLI